MEIIRREQDGLPFYWCDGLDGTAHGFSTRRGGVSPAPWDSLNLGASCGDQPQRVAENFHRFCAAIGTDSRSIIKNRQVHGRRVRPVTAADILSAPELPGTVEADGLITDVPGLCLTVFSADCLPVLLCDPQRRVIAAVHAGWRGTALGIAAQAVEQMTADYGCRPDSIRAAIGPGISACCFETRSDVPDGLRDGLSREAETCISPLPGGEKFMVDLKRANTLWLERAGVPRSSIAVCSACTACDSGDFWSHRMLGQNRGSMAAMIQLLP